MQGQLQYVDRHFRYPDDMVEQIDSFALCRLPCNPLRNSTPEFFYSILLLSNPQVKKRRQSFKQQRLVLKWFSFFFLVCFFFWQENSQHTDPKAYPKNKTGSGHGVERCVSSFRWMMSWRRRTNCVLSFRQLCIAIALQEKIWILFRYKTIV